MVIESVHSTLPIEQSYERLTVIKVIGVGGAGGNAVNCMINKGVENVQFMAVNTDAQALQRSNAPVKRALGTKLTGGLGAGGDPDIGMRAAMEDRKVVEELISGADMVFIAAGMGGGTGTGAAPVIADIAKEMDILTVGVVTTPFSIEGASKRDIAESGIAHMRESVDTLIVIQNESLLDHTKSKRLLTEAFDLANDVLSQGVEGISEIITKTGYVNVDFADVKAIMCGKGDAIMGIGVGNGDQRAVDAATAAINNPLLRNVSIDGARDVLINLTSDSGLTIDEFNEIVEIVTAKSDPRARIISGWVIDDTMSEEVKVTVIATGFSRLDNKDRDEQVTSQSSSTAVQEDRQEEFVSIDEYMQITQGDNELFTDYSNAEHVHDDNISQDLQIPALIRQTRGGVGVARG